MLRAPSCTVVLGWEDLAPKLHGKPPAEPPAQRRVTLSPSQRPAAQRPAPSPAAAKTPGQRARVSLELAIESSYPEAVLDEMRAHIDELLRRDREAKPLGQRFDQARKRLREAQARLERTSTALDMAAKAKADADDEVAQAQTALEACTNEAAEEGAVSSDTDSEMLVAARCTPRCRLPRAPAQFTQADHQSAWCQRFRPDMRHSHERARSRHRATQLRHLQAHPCRLQRLRRRQCGQPHCSHSSCL